jgi:hypothetical protein
LSALVGAIDIQVFKIKKVNTNSIRSLAMVAAMVGCVFSASADVYYKIGGTSDLQQFNIDFDHTTYNNVNVGGEQISQPGGKDPINNSMPLNYVSVCVDFLGTLYVGSTYAYTAPAVSFAGQTGIDPNWNNPTMAIQNADQLFLTYGDLGSGGMGTGGKTMSVEDMAALQLAVWMALYDTGSTGKVTVNSSSEFYMSTSGNSGNDTAAITLACQWVATLTGNYKNVGSLLQPDPTLGYQGNRDCQDPQELLYCSVPEPATILAGVLLLLPLGVSTIRNIRKSKKIV